jgi:hypothetical protein
MPTLLDTPASLSPAQLRANRALALPRIILNRLLRSWAAGLDLVWNPQPPVTTAQILAALGPEAAELFTRSAALRAFLESQKPGCTDIPSAARVKPVTLHPDGTVTLSD